VKRFEKLERLDESYEFLSKHSQLLCEEAVAYSRLRCVDHYLIEVGSVGLHQLFLRRCFSDFLREATYRLGSEILRLTKLSLADQLLFLCCGSPDCSANRDS